MWDDFTAIKWIGDYSKNPINVWNVRNDKNLSIFGIEFNTEIMHIAFHPKKCFWNQLRQFLN
jgi:hypothetical protein